MSQPGHGGGPTDNNRVFHNGQNPRWLPLNEAEVWHAWELSSRWNYRSAALLTKRQHRSEPRSGLRLCFQKAEMGCALGCSDGRKSPMIGVFRHQSGLKLKLSTSCSCQKQLLRPSSLSSTPLCPFTARWIFDRWETVYLPQGG